MIRVHVPAVLALAALTLGACADAHLRKPQIGLPAAFETQARAADPALSAATLDRWWTLFPDPQLQQLIDQALVSAPTARTALARLDEAGATRRSRLDTFLPVGNVQGSATDQHVSIGGFPTSTISAGGGGGGVGGGSGFLTGGETRTYTLSFNPSWELDVFGRSAAGRRGVNADFAATRFNVEASRMSLAAQVAQGLFQARALAVQLDDARETVRIRKESTRIGTIRAERGLGTRADAARFQSDLDSSQAEITRLEAALAGSKRTLLVLIGRGADPLESLVVEPRADAPPAVPASTPGELLARRPDVREAEARLRQEAETVALARLALFPKFTLNPGGSISKSTGASDYTTKIWSIGLSAAVPILNQPQLRADFHAERARGEQAVIAYEKAVQTAYGEAENALTTLQADQARLVQLQSAETGARYAYDAARKGYQSGLTDVTTLLDSERAWRAARSTLTNARAQALQDAVAAFKALGGGWSLSPFETAAADRSQ
jgi:NodT family efflux transporter outer membrane factor (OMF) lipoprotein